MKLDKKVIGCVVVAVVAGLWFFSNKASAETEQKAWAFDAEVGYFDNRIDGGVYTADNSAYAKLSTDITVIKSLDSALVGGLEYVDSEEYQLYTSLGTTVKGVYVGVLFSTIESDDTTSELNVGYDFQVAGLDAYLAGALLQDGEYDAAFGIQKQIFANKFVNVCGGVELGKTFDYAEDYDYRLAHLQVSTAGDYQLFARLNLLDNDLIGADWEDTVDIGVRFTF